MLQKSSLLFLNMYRHYWNIPYRINFTLYSEMQFTFILHTYSFWRPAVSYININSFDNFRFYSIFNSENECMMKNSCVDFYLSLSLNLPWNLISPGKRALNTGTEVTLILLLIYWYFNKSAALLFCKFPCLCAGYNKFKWFGDKQIKKIGFLIKAGNDIQKGWCNVWNSHFIGGSAIFTAKFQIHYTSSLNGWVVEFLININCNALFPSC